MGTSCLQGKWSQILGVARKARWFLIKLNEIKTKRLDNWAQKKRKPSTSKGCQHRSKLVNNCALEFICHNLLFRHAISVEFLDGSVCIHEIRMLRKN
jgi:hypothetical protein